MFGDGGLDIVVDRTRLDHAHEVVRIDLQDLVHPREVQDDTAAYRVGAAGQPGARAARHDGSAKLGAGADHVLYLGLGARAYSGDSLPGRGPLSLVVRDGGEHVRIGHEAVAGQPPAQRLHDQAGRGHDRASAIRAADARAPTWLMIEAA